MLFDNATFNYILLAFLIVIILSYVLYLILKNRFIFPYFEKDFDVSGKRLPDLNSLIEEYFIEGGFNEILDYQLYLNQWKKISKEKAENSFFRNLRIKQYQDSLTSFCFHFSMYRYQTRYRQINYQKTSYKVKQVIEERYYDINHLKAIYNDLESIGFEATLKDYHSSTQRRLLTKELRKNIKERDNYTCQNCGKYMPDEVGLHIDHIVPISKGGKTVPSNLQVLCSKCNGKKSSK